MTVQYRCRCGQEVILRPRETVYVVVGLLVCLTLLNTVLVGLLWWRLDGPAPSDERARVVPVSQPDAADADSRPAEPLRSAPGPVRPGPEPDRADADPASGSPSSGGVQGRTETAGPTPAALPEAAAAEPSEVAPVPASAAGDGSASTGAFEAKRLPETLILQRPDPVDGLALALAVATAPADDLEAACHLLAAVTWGSGTVRDEALRRLGEIDAPLRELVLTASRDASDTVSVGYGDLPARRPLVEALGRAWPASWERLAERAPATARRWVEEARKALPERVEILLLVDLSASMETELAAIAETLRQVVPLTLEGGGRRRWGWIGYRDEVVDSQSLTAEGPELLASLERWRCEGGGDVPEGVDRAIFEALRLGTFDWAPGAARHLIVIGDAPPPYERIAGMVSMVEGAHEAEAYRVSALGILREPSPPWIPGYRELARASGGEVRFLDGAEPLEARTVAPALWRLLAGAIPEWKVPAADGRAFPFF